MRSKYDDFFVNVEDIAETIGVLAVEEELALIVKLELAIIKDGINRDFGWGEENE